MHIQESIHHYINTLPKEVALVAVSKTKPSKDILEAYNAGQRIFGENKVQEMTQKYELLPKDISWHMIGHLQRNKVKYIAEFVDVIHAVDTLKLLQEIQKQAQKHNRKISCLLQIKIAKEDSKFGMDITEAEAILQDNYKTAYPNITIIGLMGMATFTENENQIKQEFKFLNTQFKNLKQTYQDLTVLSMGMSGDYKLAIEEGSTMVRIGSAIFGDRQYT